MPVTISGKFQDPTGAAVANGTLFLTLSQAAVLINTTQVAPSVVAILLDSTGSISSNAPQIFGNDVLSPAGTVYFAKVTNANGQTVWQPNQGVSIGGSSFNFNTALPTSAGIILANAVLQNPSATQTISGFGLTLAASVPLTVNSSATFNGNAIFNSAVTFTGNLTGTFSQLGKTIYASSLPGADCGIRINAAEALLGSTPGTIIVDANCPATTWTAVVISNNNHTLRFDSYGPYTINQIKLAGNFDRIDGPAYLTQVGGIDQFTIWSTGTDNWIQNLTLDGSANQPSHNSSDDMIRIAGSRTHVIGNRIVKSQGSGISAYALASIGNILDLEIVRNYIYNCNVATFGEGIIVAGNSPTEGVSVQNALIAYNTVNGANGDCIFVTSDASSSALATTPTLYPRVIGNYTTNCGDSSIEVSDVVIHPIIIGNIVDATTNAGILTRDTVSPLIEGNTINVEPSSIKPNCISIGPVRFEAATFEAKALVVGNTCRGFFSGSTGGAIQSQHNAVTIRGNDIEFTAGNAFIKTIVGVSGTVTLTTDRALQLPNTTNITIAGTTNYNGTFALASVNDVSRTYTFALGGSFAQETTGTVSNTTTAGGGLSGRCIITTGFNNQTVEDNRCRNFQFGLDLDFGGSTQSVSEIRVKGNFFGKIGTGISFPNVTFSNSDFENNYVEQVLTTAFANGSGGSASSGSNSSYWVNNHANLSGWSGAAPGLFNIWPLANFADFEADNTGKIAGSISQPAYLLGNGFISSSGSGFNIPNNSGQGNLGYVTANNRWMMSNNGLSQTQVMGWGDVTITLKKGSGGGNYTNATTSYTVADSTNLCYTVTIPSGFKLGISASGALSTATAAVVAQAALTDNAACSTANAGILVETAPIQGAGIGIADAFALNWVITGDGNSHNIALQFKTSNAADTVSLINSSATVVPTMKFELMPSN